MRRSIADRRRARPPRGQPFLKRRPGVTPAEMAALDVGRVDADRVMDAAHRVSCRQRVSRAPQHPSVVTPKPPRLPETSSLPAVDSCPKAGGTPCSRRMRTRSTRSAARSRGPPTPEASVPVHPAASLHSRPGAAGGSLGSATRARARRVGRGVPGTRARPPGTTSLGGGGAPRLARGAGSAAQLSPLVGACPPPRLSQPTTSMRAPDPPDRHGISPCSSTRCPDKRGLRIRRRRTRRLRPTRDRRPPPRVLPRHRRRSAHTDPARRATRTRREHPTDNHHLAVGVQLVDAGGEHSAAACACWLSTRKGLVWVVADPAGRTSASEPTATEARPRRGAEREAMIETRGA
jgi:hypothetical protein